MRFIRTVREFNGELVVTIPKPIMKSLGWKTGERVIVGYDEKLKVIFVTKA